MIKPLILGMGLAGTLLSPLAMAYQYGEYAGVTVDTLINDYPGRYRGTANFAGATDWMEQRLSAAGYNTSRQDFTWAGNRSSQNVIVEASGVTGRNLVVGAHFDTFFGRPTLQGLDDNASGAGVLTEIARNLAGLSFEDGVTFIGFGAEEEGLRGSRAYVAALDAEARANLIGMINIDSLVTGDMMYAHAGSDSTAAPELASLREHTLRIAEELGIDLHTNPGLNPGYPAGTGCCSDGESFENLGIPVLFVEATNWDIGALDGYDQTTNPAIPGGQTWHNPALDNEAVLVGALGEERIAQRLRDYSRLLTRLVLEATNTDLRYAAQSGGAMLGTLEDTLKRQKQTHQYLLERRWQTLRASPREVGSGDASIGIEGQITPKGGIDSEPEQRSQQATVYLFGDKQLNEWLNVGAGLSFSRGKDDLENGGNVDSNTWQAGLYALLGNAGPLWLNADLSVGRTSFDLDRSVFIQGNAGGPVLLDHRFSSNTEATFLGGSLLGGYEWQLGNWRTGPQLGIDYRQYKVDGFSEKSSLRTALRFDDERFDSLELSLGWQVQGSLALDNGMHLQPYASLAWVEELGDGLSDDFLLTSQADGSIRRTINTYDNDKHFARGRLGAQLAVNDAFAIYLEGGGRLQHSDGNQASYNLGLQYQF
nr:autotransporter domain-containing protein [Pseudomonas mendocina]